MTETCPKCGLPKDICVCKSIAREGQKIEVSLSERSFGKKMTVIKGLDDKEVDISDLETKLKSKLACGGTAKDGVIELQGDHTRRIEDVLVDLGFEEESIEVQS
ncbi:MAG: translation initiation factor [Candidatus Nanohaloarchaeota archaeon QJJ-5]|nr:translation initiation factor [Candidatus Nanohaloarchaeota archaeon QJJ-5]